MGLPWTDTRVAAAEVDGGGVMGGGGRGWADEAEDTNVAVIDVVESNDVADVDAEYSDPSTAVSKSGGRDGEGKGDGDGRGDNGGEERESLFDDALRGRGGATKLAGRTDARRSSCCSAA
jgi:hypothetical protein